MQIGFIFPDNKRIGFSYEELGLMVEKFIKPYKNNDDYLAFCKKYEFMNPDYYYLILRKNIKVINPFYQEDMILSGVNDILVSKNINTAEKDYILSSNNDLKYQKLNTKNLLDGFITPDLYQIESCRNKNINVGHDEIAKMIINDLSMKDKNFVKTYLETYQVGDFYRGKLNYDWAFLIKNYPYILVSKLSDTRYDLIYNSQFEELKKIILKIQIDNPDKLIIDLSDPFENEKRR